MLDAAKIAAYERLQLGFFKEPIVFLSPYHSQL